MSNPFNDHLDWTFQGKYCRVYSSGRIYHGWVDILHHNRGSVILHDAEDVTPAIEQGTDATSPGTRNLGSVFVRTCDHIEGLSSERDSQAKRIELLDLAFVVDSPYLDYEYEPRDYHMRRAYRNGFVGSFPVVRPVYPDTEGDPQHHELLNGHKRVAALRRVGVEMHPFEVFECSDEVAEELVALAHRDEMGKHDQRGADEAVCQDCGESHDDGACWDGEDA